MMLATATSRIARLRTIISILLLLLAASGLRAQSAPWQIVGPYGGEVSSIASIGTTLFAATWHNGVFKSTDNGEHWSQLPYRFRYAQIKRLETHDSLLFAIGAGIYRSGDQGETWVEIHPPTINGIDGLCFIGETLYGAAHMGDIYRSYDYGTTWKWVGHAPGVWFSLLAAHEGKLFFSADSGFYRSDDSGASWNRVMVTTTGIEVRAFAAHGSVMVLTIGDYSSMISDRIYRSTNRGATWHSAGTGISADRIRSIIWDGSRFLATGGYYGGIFTSATGENWQKIEGDFVDEITTICVTGQGIFAGSARDRLKGGGIYRSTDNGRIWKLVNTGFSSIDITSLAEKGGKLFAAGGNGMYVSTDNGTQWRRPTEMPRYDEVQEVDVVKGGMIASTNRYFNIDDTGRIYRMRDGQNSWDLVATHIGHIGPIATSGNLVAAILRIPDPVLSTSTDGGLTWAAHRSLPDTTNDPGNYIQKLQFVGDTLWMLARKTILRSTDIGRTWEIVEVEHDFGHKYFKALGSSNGVLFIGTEDPPGIYRSTDNGASWTQVYRWAGFEYTYISHFASRGNTILASAYSAGMARSTDNGENWEPFNNGLANLSIAESHFAENAIFAIPTNGGIYRTMLPSSVTSEREPEEPATDRLYPNPCGASATVRYDVPASGGGAAQVVIGILNTLGEPVRNVLSERQIPGTYQANIDLAGLENGAYFYSLVIGDKCVVRPFLVMK